MMLFVDVEVGSIKLDRIEIRRANSDEIDDVLFVFDEVAAWLASVRVQQWPLRFRHEWVSSSVEDGYTWLVHVDSRLAATLVLDWSDPIWDANDRSAGYVHRLAVRRHAAGLGSHQLAWAEREACLRDRQFLRLDCVAANCRLCDSTRRPASSTEATWRLEAHPDSGSTRRPRPWSAATSCVSRRCQPNP